MPRNRKPKPIQNADPKPVTSAEVSKILYSPGFDKLDPELQTAILRKLILDDSTQASNTPPAEDFAAYKDRTLFNSKLLAFWLVLGLFSLMFDSYKGAIL